MMLTFCRAVSRHSDDTRIPSDLIGLPSQGAGVPSETFFQKKSCSKHEFDESIDLTNCLSLRPATEDSRGSEAKAMLIIVERVIIAIQLYLFALREKFNFFKFLIQTRNFSRRRF